MGRQKLTIEKFRGADSKDGLVLTVCGPITPQQRDALAPVARAAAKYFETTTDPSAKARERAVTR